MWLILFAAIFCAILALPDLLALYRLARCWLKKYHLAPAEDFHILHHRWKCHRCKELFEINDPDGYIYDGMKFQWINNVPFVKVYFR